jgi:hypothetical protein
MVKTLQSNFRFPALVAPAKPDLECEGAALLNRW